MIRRKIVGALCNNGRVFYVDSERGDWACARQEFADRLAKSGQRVKAWPTAGFGVVEIEDIPKPEPLPPAYLMRAPSGQLYWHRSATSDFKGWSLVASVTFGDDGEVFVTRREAGA